MDLGAVRRWTGVLYASPERFIDTTYDWDSFDLEEWSQEEYTWEPDEWYGFKDLAKPPAETIETGSGDCDCYAVVAMNARYHDDADGLGLGFLYRFPPAPDSDAGFLEGLAKRLEVGHAIAYDDERVYSSGHITEETPEEFKEREGYSVLLRRDL